MKTKLLFAFLLVTVRAKHHLSHHATSFQVDLSSLHAIRLTVDEIDGAPSYPAERIINGIQATRGQFPYQAALFIDQTNFCGGSLISRRWVLTAAHCVSGHYTITVYLGTQDWSANENGRFIVETTQKIVHPGYSSLTLNNDIALVHLGTDVPISNYIQPISLDCGNDLFVNATVRLSGWGQISQASSISRSLNYVDLKVISNEECQQTFGVYIRSSNICTIGTAGRCGCNGDDGGPLVDCSTGKQIGILIFFSSGGCNIGSPNCYILISPYCNWIYSNTGIKPLIT